MRTLNSLYLWKPSAALFGNIDEILSSIQASLLLYLDLCGCFSGERTWVRVSLRGVANYKQAVVKDRLSPANSSSKLQTPNTYPTMERKDPKTWNQQGPRSPLLPTATLLWLGWRVLAGGELTLWKTRAFLSINNDQQTNVNRVSKPFRCDLWTLLREPIHQSTISCDQQPAWGIESLDTAAYGATLLCCKRMSAEGD
jgi:hypothetical protein